MKRKSRTGKFWMALTVVNLVAIGFSYISLVQADSTSARLFAAIVYFGTLVLLAIVDVVAFRSTHVHRGELLDFRK